MPRKKRAKKKGTEPIGEPGPAGEAETAPTGEPRASGGGSGDILKVAAVIVLFGILIILALHFLSGSSFQPGPEVDAETFKDIFEEEDNIFIFMDIKGVSNAATRSSILQCGIDFAASSGMGGKNVTYFSRSDENCVAPDGFHDDAWCFDQLKGGVAIYVKEGTGGAKYHSNGMVVSVGPEYTLGTCGIHKVR